MYSGYRKHNLYIRPSLRVFCDMLCRVLLNCVHVWISCSRLSQSCTHHHCAHTRHRSFSKEFNRITLSVLQCGQHDKLDCVVRVWGLPDTLL